jgi:hypothetical protein
VKAHAAVAALASLHGNFCFIDKFHRVLGLIWLQLYVDYEAPAAFEAIAPGRRHFAESGDEASSWKGHKSARSPRSHRNRRAPCSRK